MNKIKLYSRLASPSGFAAHRTKVDLTAFFQNGQLEYQKKDNEARCHYSEAIFKAAAQAANGTGRDAPIQAGVLAVAGDALATLPSRVKARKAHEDLAYKYGGSPAVWAAILRGKKAGGDYSDRVRRFIKDEIGAEGYRTQIKEVKKRLAKEGANLSNAYDQSLAEINLKNAVGRLCLRCSAS
ncbi:hypothetical protein [Treponema endosymbiont of Eucomonympha sp.]|uniref:hypothetical protein n=1 Tax=Treponema endosymbiont of Eucomonympha sp. TaxID=1580831 RepID=UPI000AB4848C|nr:hypothetical protein [Treponema endosymbiont of Eucomonympha sp.]